MAISSPRSPQNSTIGRLSRAAAAAALRLTGALRPALADEWAADLFCTTRRPAVLREPEVEGLAAHRFELAFGARKIVAWDWGEGPTVVLAHGWNGCAAQLRRLVAPLVASGHYVVAFDQPAHGWSEGRMTTLREMAEATFALGRRTGPVRAVVGHSLGAAAAALALANGLRAARAVLLAPPATPRPFLELLGAGLRLSASRRRGLVSAMERRLGPLDSYDLRLLSPRLRAEALIVHDPSDPEVPFEHGRAIASAWPGAQLRPATGVGHRRILADPQVVRAVVAFVSGNDPAQLARSA